MGAGENICRDAADLAPLCQNISATYLERIGQASWANVTCPEIANTSWVGVDGSVVVLMTRMYENGEMCCGARSRMRCLDDSNICKMDTDLAASNLSGTSAATTCDELSHSMLLLFPGKTAWSNVTCAEVGVHPQAGTRLAQDAAACCGGKEKTRCLDSSNLCAREALLASACEEHSDWYLHSMLSTSVWRNVSCTELALAYNGSTRLTDILQSNGASCCGNLSNVRCSCRAGTFYNAVGSGGCDPCGEGTYSNMSGRFSNDTCTQCPPNSSSRNSSASSITHCTCNQGYFGPDGGPCAPCAAGKFKPVHGSHNCTSCAADKYSNVSAQVSNETCVDCPANSYAPAGSSALTACICNAGYTGPEGSACTECPAGTFKNVSGPTPCLQCARGKYLNRTASVSEDACILCPQHSWSQLASPMITNCSWYVYATSHRVKSSARHTRE